MNESPEFGPGLVQPIEPVPVWCSYLPGVGWYGLVCLVQLVPGWLRGCARVGGLVLLFGGV